jgi:uncharacterized protein (TIGR04255 family)
MVKVLTVAPMIPMRPCGTQDRRGMTVAHMSRRYVKSPLVEAIFEFAPATSAFDEASMVSLRAACEDYPQEELVRALGIRFEFTPPGPPIGSPQPGIERYRRWNSQKTRLVQFGRDIFCFNVLPPYGRYTDYLPEIERLLVAYQKAASPNGVLFLGQRYRNQIVLPSESTRASDFFTLYPRLPEMSRSHPPYFLQVEMKQFPDGGQVVSTIACQERRSTDQGPTYVLDVYARSPDNPAINFSWEAVREWHREAHETITMAFESSLTDQAKRYFGAEEMLL